MKTISVTITNGRKF